MLLLKRIVEGVKKNKARVVSNGQVTRSTVRWAKEPDLPSADNWGATENFQPYGEATTFAFG